MNDNISLYPTIERSFSEIKDVSIREATRLFGKPLPEGVSRRLDWELEALSCPEYATIFLICKKLADKAREDGYPFGTRGTLGASLVAFLLGITEINPLKDGFNIPAETLFGYDGKKTLDINFNFAPSYKWKAINYLCELFGKDRIVLANTSELSEEPYGVIVLPENADIEKLTSVRDYENNGRIYRMAETPFYDIKADLMKINLLSHHAPEMLKRLTEETGKPENEIPLEDDNVMAFFRSGDCPGGHSDIHADSYGLPEFGSDREREMIELLHPDNITDLAAISALSHGTGVYEGNAKKLIANGIATLRDVISYRDHIMLTLMQNGVDCETAYNIMETVRKGKVSGGKATQWEEYSKIMKAYKIPSWYIESMEKIVYLFPKAHCAAYTLLTWKLAWYKVHFSETFNRVCLYGDQQV